MNFLAHAVFADGPDEVLLGSLVGDFFKRPDISQFPEAFITGLEVHKELDRHFDSSYPSVTSNESLFSLIRHYSAPVIDVCSDHILANRWKDIFDSKIGDFVGIVYEIVGTHRSYIPPDRQRVISRMTEQDWLGQMSSMDGLESALMRLSRSSHRADVVREHIPAILELVPSMEEGVLSALPLIRTHMCDYMQDTLLLDSVRRLSWRDEICVSNEFEGRPQYKER
ncbi:hypothetical protein COY16_06070 [Candidatus Roizmanbacteria bacterium CG_4_10_14_0_2_um_filter_39_13]|uniref:DUF479 domain-containing protein n=1 Tax=Candidatus Roizmanbacteria bacterium CG_4_10_14_0_2_um_filter_39_13 TaxID=1974825 RepID=A0A2M7TV65_9BACT|nr:MAG: hypothetical protein COY16_06070 [Candidatus Roizmanbacteria bacterium CG_4_10_14_0_2_um_filter_39_13]